MTSAAGPPALSLFYAVLRGVCPRKTTDFKLPPAPNAGHKLAFLGNGLGRSPNARRWCSGTLLAGGPAFYVQLQIFLFPLEQAVRQQLLLDVLKADALHRVGEALAGQALLPE